MEATISYDKMTQEDFDRGLRNILTMTSAASLLSIPGIYEILSEELNNEVLDNWVKENPHLAWSDHNN